MLNAFVIRHNPLSFPSWPKHSICWPFSTILESTSNCGTHSWLPLLILFCGSNFGLQAIIYQNLGQMWGTKAEA